MMKNATSYWGALVMAVALAQPNLVQAQSFIDDFNDNTINSSLWVETIVGTGPSLNEVNQRLEVTIPGTSIGVGDVINGQLDMKDSLSGDFDARVDYSLIEWPAQNEVRLGIGLQAVGMQRISFLSGDRYMAPSYSGSPSISTSDTQGKLRFTRTGSTYSGYFWSDSSSSWVLLGSGLGPSGAVNLAVGAWSHDSVFQDKSIKVAFDNFEVTAVPEPQHYFLMGSALLSGFAFLRMKRPGKQS